jgi:hypothetical protein
MGEGQPNTTFYKLATVDCVSRETLMEPKRKLPQDTRYALHQVPIGILTPERMNVLANGVAVDADALSQELSDLKKCRHHRCGKFTNLRPGPPRDALLQSGGATP